LSSKKVSGTHTYATAGEYTVTLTVSDGKLPSTPVTVKVNADDEDVLDCTLK
ncbi:PKD domain-containing protein, partial [Ruminobacter sp.]|uniref:PKD domain-containing protein n=1 Tax=Ruminobacter sp. TaxID=2774296 RepID=UPI00386A49F3